MAELGKKVVEKLTTMLGNEDVTDQPHSTTITTFASVIEDKTLLKELTLNYYKEFYADKRNRRLHSTIKLLISTLLTWVAYAIFGILI